MKKGKIPKLIVCILFAVQLVSCIEIHTVKAAEKGQKTKEEVVLTFMEALKNQDVEKMLSLFAIDSYVQNFDIRVLEKYGTYNLRGDSLLPISNNQFAKDLNIMIRKYQIVKDLRYLYQALASGLGVGSLTLETGESGQDVLDHFWLVKDEEDLFDIEVEDDFVDAKALYDSQNTSSTSYEEYVGKDIERRLKYLRCDEIQPMAVQFEWNGLPLILFMEVVRYDDNWMILEMGGTVLRSMGYSDSTFVIPASIFEEDEKQEEFWEELAGVLTEINLKEQDENTAFIPEEKERRGYESPEEAIEDFFEKMKQNDLEGMLDALDYETLVQRINLAKKIEIWNRYDWMMGDVFPEQGPCAEALSVEFLKNFPWIEQLYLNLAGEGIDPEATWHVDDIDKFVNSIEKAGWAKLQCGEITEIPSETIYVKDHADIDEEKAFSVELTLGDHSENFTAICICYDGKWTVYRVI